jgi:hypothetical protein
MFKDDTPFTDVYSADIKWQLKTDFLLRQARARTHTHTHTHTHKSSRTRRGNYTFCLLCTYFLAVKLYFDLFQVFKSNGIQYKKIFCPGRVIPADILLRE